MFFITNRQIKTTNPDNSFQFRLNENAPNQEVFFCHRKAKDTYQEIGFPLFFQTLSSLKYKNILFYIHGFNNFPEEDIFPMSLNLQNHFNLLQKEGVLIIPIIWPCDNDLGLIKDYWDDQKAADMSAFSFARALSKLVHTLQEKKTSCTKSLNILAHSMGNRVLRETFRVWAKYDLNHEIPQLFRNIFLVAADLRNDTFNPQHSGDLIAQAARNVIIYHANDDLLLRTSKVMNRVHKIATKRLGHTGPINPLNIATNIYTIDCDNINNLYDFPYGHTYFYVNQKDPGLVFNHIHTTLLTGRPLPKNMKSSILETQN